MANTVCCLWCHIDSQHLDHPTLNRAPMQALMDLWSTITLMLPSILPRHVKLCSSLPITCVHGDIQVVPAAEVWLRGTWGEWPLLVELVLELPISLLVGWTVAGWRLIDSKHTKPRYSSGAEQTVPIFVCFLRTALQHHCCFGPVTCTWTEGRAELQHNHSPFLKCVETTV